MEVASEPSVSVETVEASGASWRPRLSAFVRPSGQRHQVSPCVSSVTDAIHSAPALGRGMKHALGRKAGWQRVPRGVR